MPSFDDTGTHRSNLSFIRRSMKTAILSRDREFVLAQRWREHGDRAALHELVSAYTRLVVATAGRYRNYGLPLGDLIQEGNLGLMQAAARFEPEREVRFSTYAVWWIRAQMQDFILRNWSIVRTGTTAAQKSLFFNLRRLRARIGEGGGGPLGREAAERIARELAVSVGEVEDMQARLAAPDQSLNAGLGEGGDTDEWQDALADLRPDPEAAAIDQGDSRKRLSLLAQALGELDRRERSIINERRLKEDGTTLEELGRDLGVSKERVRQLEQRALLKLRAALRRRIADPADLFGGA